MFKFKLHPEETLLKIDRQSKIVLLKPEVLLFLLIYIPWEFLIKYDLHIRFGRFLAIWTLIILGWSIHKYLLWLINVYIVTDKRLVVVSYKSLFHKIVQETPLERIHNISSETKGFAGSLFKIGNVIVQIASLSHPLILENLKNPEELKDFLWTTHQRQK